MMNCGGYTLGGYRGDTPLPPVRGVSEWYLPVVSSYICVAYFVLRLCPLFSPF